MNNPIWFLLLGVAVWFAWRKAPAGAAAAASEKKSAAAKTNLNPLATPTTNSYAFCGPIGSNFTDAGPIYNQSPITTTTTVNPDRPGNGTLPP